MEPNAEAALEFGWAAPVVNNPFGGIMALLSLFDSN